MPSLGFAVLVYVKMVMHSTDLHGHLKIIYVHTVVEMTQWIIMLKSNNGFGTKLLLY